MKEFVKSITSPYEKELIETRRCRCGSYNHNGSGYIFNCNDYSAYRGL